MTLFEANKNNLIVRYTELFTTGSAKVYYAEFSFSADWNGFAKIATFRNGSVSKNVAVDEENAFEIPWEVFVNPGTLECGITGTKADGTTLPTIWATVATIKQGAEIGDEAKEVTPDIYEQLISRLDEGVTQAQNAAERAEAAAINQPYPNQVTGTWWVWNPETGEYVDSGISSAAYTLPPMTGAVLGGAMADPARTTDTQPVRIGADHKLYTAPGGGGESSAYPVVDMTADNAELAPNTYYKWGEIATLSITLGEPADATITNEYCFEFVSGETATTLTVPSDIKWVQEPTIESGKTYQVSILNGIGVIYGA